MTRSKKKWLKYYSNKWNEMAKRLLSVKDLIKIRKMEYVSIKNGTPLVIDFTKMPQ